MKKELEAYCLLNSKEFIQSHLLSPNCLVSGLFQDFTDNVYLKDTNSRFLFINQAFSDWTGISSEQIYGKTDFDLFTKAHASKAFSDEQNIIKNGESLRNIEEKETWPDGRITWVSTSKMPIKNADGEIIGIFGISRNITHNKELENQLLQAQKLESVGQLASGIAHEINTPIQFVGDNLHFLQDSISDLLTLSNKYANLIELIKAGKVDATTIQQHEEALKTSDIEYLNEELPLAIKQSIEGAQRVSRIVRAMKEFAHPSSGDMAYESINDAIETTIIVAKNEWKYVAKIETNFAEDLPSVPCLIGEFNQVILNMIVNARDAIEETGKDGIIYISTSHTKSHAIVQIRDTGAGMPKATLSRIFDPFFTTKEVGKGSGQGLAIAYNLIVKKHQGKLDVDSSPGNGTTFTISLPLEPNESAESEDE